MVKLKIAGRETVSPLAFGADGLFADLTTKGKAGLSMGAGAYYLGLGFIIGVRYASIICAGSLLSCFVIIPLLAPLNLEQLQLLNPAIAGTTVKDIFDHIPKNIGIGCIFTAGILSILKMSGVIVTALRKALGSLAQKSRAGAGVADRTDEDVSYGVMAVLGLIVVVVMGFFFYNVALKGIPNARGSRSSPSSSRW